MNRFSCGHSMRGAWSSFWFQAITWSPEGSHTGFLPSVATDGMFFMHDPAAIRDDQGMAAAAETYAVPWTAFDPLTHLGRERLSAAIVIRKGPSCPAGSFWSTSPKTCPTLRPPQGDHDERVSRPSAPVRHGTAEARQSGTVLCLSVEGLLRLAAGGSARPSGHADRRDHARAARGQALRACAAEARGRAQPLRAPGRLPARGRVQTP